MGLRGVSARDLQGAVDWIYASLARSRAPKAPDRIRRHPEWTVRLYRELGESGAVRQRTVVAGSKGKGSTAAMLAALLGQVRPGVLLFTGPDLGDFRERIRVDGVPVSTEELWAGIDALEGPLARVGPVPPEQYLGPVGLTALIALVLGGRHGVWAEVLECGRGARSDDVAALEHRVGVLTPVFLEHVAELGPTIAQIGWEKAGVAGWGTEIVISARQRPPVRLALERQAHRVGARVWRVGRELRVGRVRAGREWTVADFETPGASYRDVPVALLGAHQAENALLALGAAEAVLGEALDPARVAAALSGVQWPGRLERVAGDPEVVLDGAIGGEGARRIAAYLAATTPTPRVALVGVPVNKDVAGVVAALRPHVDALWASSARAPWVHFPGEVPRGADALIPSLGHALELGRMRARGGSLWIVGTQSFIGEALALVKPAP